MVLTANQLCQAQEEAVQKQVAEHAQQAAALAAGHTAELQRLEQQLAEQRAVEQAAQAQWVATQRRLEQAIEDAAGQLEAAKQQAQVPCGFAGSCRS